MEFPVSFFSYFFNLFSHFLFFQIQILPGDFRIEFRTLPSGDVEDNFHPPCGFLLTRGPNKGKLCGQKGVESHNGFFWYPSCNRHLRRFLDSRTAIFEVNTVVAPDTLLPMSATIERTEFRATWLTPAGVANEQAQRLTEMYRMYLERRRVAEEQEAARIARGGAMRTLDMALVPKAMERRHFCPVCIRGREEEETEEDREETPPVFLLMPCGHTICKDCYEKIVVLQCGECRKSFEEKDLRAL